MFVYNENIGLMIDFLKNVSLRLYLAKIWRKAETLICKMYSVEFWQEAIVILGQGLNFENSLLGHKYKLETKANFIL